MKRSLTALCLMTYQATALAAAEAAPISPTGSLLKMVLGLVVVLVVMMLISWAVKRMMPHATSHNAVIKVLGGASVGSRERVVVLEVAGRWLVVGVAQGQVNAIANLEAGADLATAATAINETVDADIAQAATAAPVGKPFSAWLKKSTQAAKRRLGRQSS